MSNLEIVNGRVRVRQDPSLLKQCMDFLLWNRIGWGARTSSVLSSSASRPCPVASGGTLSRCVHGTGQEAPVHVPNPTKEAGKPVTIYILHQGTTYEGGCIESVHETKAGAREAASQAMSCEIRGEGLEWEEDDSPVDPRIVALWWGKPHRVTYFKIKEYEVQK